MTGDKVKELLELMQLTPSAHQLTEAQKSEIFERRGELWAALYPVMSILQAVEAEKQKQGAKARDLGYLKQDPDPSWAPGFVVRRLELVRDQQ